MNDFKTILLILFLCFGFMACNEESTPPGNSEIRNEGEVGLVKAPDIIAWTGGERIGSTMKETGRQPEDDDDQPDNEIEINLAVNNELVYRVCDYVSKLSMHIRYKSDVEIVMPVPARFFCSRNDIADEGVYESGEFKYSGHTYKTEYLLGTDSGTGLPLSVTVNYIGEFQDPDYPLGCIRVKTEGIDTPEGERNPLDWCAVNFGDCLTFEIMVYYNKGYHIIDGEKVYEDRALLKKILDNTKVIFTKVPEIYVNALSEHKDDGFECTVRISDSQKDYFCDPIEGDHWNGSNNNIIYINKESPLNPDNQEPEEEPQESVDSASD